MIHPKGLIRIFIITAVMIFGWVFIPWVMVKAWISPLPDTVQEQIDLSLDYDLDGIIVYIDQSGKKPELFAAGWKDRENKVPADPIALFKIASISKLYIAVATVKLVKRKSLSLDNSLADYLPELIGRIENAERITLRMLLQHRSGIPDWIEDPEFPWASPMTDVDKVLELALDEQSDFEPDSRYDYSNTNYLLIGKILDKTLGYDHQRYIKTAILDPLGLTHTFGLLTDVDAEKVVSGYDSHFEDDVKMLDFVSPGGSMVATAEDVGIFLRVLNNGTLLDKEEQAIYATIYEFDHTGLLPGYQSIARYHKDIDAVVVQFVNTSGGNAWTVSEIVYNRIVRILRRNEIAR
jgi:CubicO group peptidase (beta-lactamase class C family)